MAKRKEIDPEFGRRLRFLREQGGLTQAELGTRAEIPANTIARLERAEREPTWGAIKRLAEALGAELNDFRDPVAAGDDGQGGDQPDEPAPRPSGKRK